MSAFVLVYHRNGLPIEQGVALERMMEPLAHRGPDGRDVWLRGPVGLGHWHFWTTPEEEKERQPLIDAQGTLAVLFDGRLDNRSELLAALTIAPMDGREMSDANLILHAYKHWRADLFEHLLGPFAIVIWDEAIGQIVVARDALGDRTLFYYLDRRVLLIASEPYALLAHPAVNHQINETSLVQFLTARPSGNGATFFTAVQELLPAQAMLITSDKMRRWIHWQPESKTIRYRSDDEYAEHYRTLLVESVRCCLRTITPPAVMMSGGLDSTSVAAIASRELAGRHAGKLTTVSYVFDELHSCDERQYINEMTARYQTDAIHLLGDDSWPLKDVATWPNNPNMPGVNIYWRLYERVYKAVRDKGTRTLLTGWFSEHLYTGAEQWLVDLLREGRLGESTAEFIRNLRRQGLRSSMVGGSVIALGGRLIAPLPGSWQLRRHLGRRKPSWLTPYALSLLDDAYDWPPSAAFVNRPGQHRSVLGAGAAKGSSSVYFENHAGLEKRFPFRDRRLVSFMLGIPAHQFFRLGRYKHIQRNAMRHTLPGIIRSRTHPTSLMPLYVRGLAHRESDTVKSILNSNGALWSRYVDANWLWSVLHKQVMGYIDGVEALIPWLCISLELWRQKSDLPLTR